MKQTGDAVEELMINLFSIIAEQVRDKQELFDDEGKITQTLLNNGYHIYEADAALMLMQALVQGETGRFLRPETAQSTAYLRIMNREERERFALEAFAFTSKLTHLGVVSEQQREEILDKALTICNDRIELEHIKSIVAMVLFSRPMEQEPDENTAFSNRQIKRTAWN